MDIIYRFDPSAPLTPVIPEDCKAALSRLESGHRFFSDIVEHVQLTSTVEVDPKKFVVPVDPITLGVPVVPGRAPLHSPFACVLGCSDARMPIEHIFHCNSNELFIARVAGNTVGPDTLASIEYAVQHLGRSLRAAIVLGHTDCGAVSATVDRFLRPREYLGLSLSRAMRTLTDRMMDSVRGSSEALIHVAGESIRNSVEFRELLVEVSVYVNAAANAYEVSQEIKQSGSREIGVVYSVYDLRTARVAPYPMLDGEEDSMFVEPPSSADRFSEFARTIAKRVMARASQQDSDRS